MKHVKTYHSVTRHTENGPVIIEGPLPSSELNKYHFHEDLIAFRPAPQQFKAILGIADLPEGRLIIARADRKSTRLNSSHVAISYAVFCLKKKNKNVQV